MTKFKNTLSLYFALTQSKKASWWACGGHYFWLWWH
jgi:hypothetical protein